MEPSETNEPVPAPDLHFGGPPVVVDSEPPTSSVPGASTALMEFAMLHSDTPDGLTSLVNASLRNGWYLHGNPVHSTQDRYNSTWGQAMLRFTDGPA